MAGGSGRLDASLWSAPVRVQLRSLAMRFNSSLNLGVGHGNHGLHCVLEPFERFRAFDHFRRAVLHISIIAQVLSDGEGKRLNWKLFIHKGYWLWMRIALK